MGFYRQRTFGSFDPTKQLIAGRQMSLNEHELTGGDPIPMDTDEGIRRRLWMVEHAHYEEDYRPTAELLTHGEDLAWMDEADGVTVTAGENGWYTIHAPWLGEDGEKVRGAADAEARAAEVRETGDTKGVEFTHKGGGRYEITAPFLSEPEKVKGKDAAMARVVELREQAPPPGSTEAGAADADTVTDAGGEATAPGE